jgi:ABC-2 type transport system permease protein
MALKEFRQLRRDRRTVALMIGLPLLLLVVFGYAASFDVSSLKTIVVGPGAGQVAAAVPEQIDVTAQHPAEGRADAVRRLRDGQATVAIVTGAQPVALVDGSDLFAAKAAVAVFGGRPGLPAPQVLFNPELKTSAMMVPALTGLILVFIGTVATSLGVVRERQSGTLEQLAVMPFRPRDVFVGKILPYFAVATVDLVVIAAVGIALFQVPFRGSPWVLVLGALEFLFVTLGIGVLVSTVSQNQGQAIQLAMMTMLPQVLLSGMIFPLSSMASGVRWIGYILPLTYFIQISRGVMLRGASLASLATPLLALGGLGLVVFTLSVLRFRRDLAPAGERRRPRRASRPEGSGEPQGGAPVDHTEAGAR